MDVPQSKKKSKAPSPPIEAGISKMDTSHNGEVKEIRMPAKPSSSFNKKEADGSQTSDKTTKPSVPSLAKRHETVEEGVDRKHGSTLPSSSCTATTIPVAPHRPSKSLEEKPKQPLPPWMTDMATKDQKRLCAVWLKTLDRSDHSHSSHNVMEKVAKFEASSSVKVPISFRKVAPLPPSRQEALKKSVELDVHPPKRELRRVMSQPPSRPSAVKKVGNVYSTTDENSELNQPVPKPRLKVSVFNCSGLVFFSWISLKEFLGHRIFSYLSHIRGKPKTILNLLGNRNK
ncbi:hypothetical protein OESDEN_04502 [Oesophagostomum dentatum]|uniref:Uncharacterized protein n=1 Tax=Oesophagostomum dentatum TaxID=61180 RepID=A0A0B1TE61_OESDE|nr:hypothetical protein OESDEN_04502 [Oesophagostomum dentatum]